MQETQVDKLEYEITKFRVIDAVASENPKQCVEIHNFPGCYGVKVVSREFNPRRDGDDVITPVEGKSISQTVYDELKEDGKVIIPPIAMRRMDEKDCVEQVAEQIRIGVENYVRNNDISCKHNSDYLGKIGYSNVIQP